MRQLNRWHWALLGVICAATALGADWPQWRGLKRDGVSAEAGLLKSWPKDGPKLLWTYKNAGAGYSTPSIVGDRLYLQGARGDSEFVFALDLKANPPKEVWAVKVGPTFTWKGNEWNVGPSAAPVVDGGMVYALGGQGDLVCVGADGKEVWRKSLPRDLGGEVNPIGGGTTEPTPLGWGYTTSPLVDGDHLIVVPGGPKGLVAALNKKTGATVWQSKEVPDQAPYASPILADVGGIRQVVQMTYLGTVGVAAKDGKLLWYAKRKRPYPDVLIPTPLFHDNHVFATSGHGGAANTGCDLIKLTPDGKGGIGAETVYANRNMANMQGGVVRVGEHVYGYSENMGWTCLLLKDGSVAWKERGSLKRGAVTAADGCLYCLDEEGTAALVEASPAGWKELSRFALPEQSKLRRSRGKIWTPPVIADGKLYLRDQELLFGYDVKGK